MRDDLRSLTLVADGRSYDLVVPYGAPVSDVLAALGIGSSASPLAVATPAGRVFGPAELIDDALPDGSVLVVIPMTTHAVHRDVVQLDRSGSAQGRRRRASADAAGSRWSDQSTLTRISLNVDDATRRRDELSAIESAGRPGGRRRRPRSGAVPAQAWWVLVVASALTAIGIALGLEPGSQSWITHPWVPPLILIGLLIALTASRAVGRASGLGLVAVVPVVAVAAGMTVPWGGPADHGLGLLTGLVLALAALGVLRIWSPGHVELVLILTVGVIALVVGAGVVLGWPAAAAAAVIAGLVPPFLRVLPTATMVVEPGQLIDVSRLSTTVWTAREGRRPAPWKVLGPEIGDAFGRARDVTAVASVYAVVALSVSAWIVALTTQLTGWARYATFIFLVVASAAVGYQSRSVRDPIPRYAMVTAAFAVAAAGATYALRTWPGAVMPVVGTAVALAVVALAASVSLAGGYRSTRLSRLADLVEGLCVALSLPLAIIAAGGVEALRSLTSG